MGDALQRKLQPIYDALDARQWKAALKLCNAALSKYKGQQLLRTLKALALYHNGKADEAMELCDGVFAECPTDEHLLSTLSLVYKLTGRAREVGKAYAAAAACEPKNMALLEGLFAAHVRQFDFSQQQQAALKMHRLATQVGAPERERYMWWVVASVALQARAALRGSAGPGLPVPQLLTLAEGLAAKQAGGEGGKLESFEALLLYVDILQAQGKHAQALELVQGPLGCAIPIEAERQRMTAALKELQGDHADAAELYRATLLSNPDDWDACLAYLDTCLPTMRAAAGDPRPPCCFISGGLTQAAHHRWQGGGGSGEGEDGSRSSMAKGYAHEEGEPLPLDGLRAVQSTLGSLGRAAADNAFLAPLAARGGVRTPALAQVELSYRLASVAGGREWAAQAAAGGGEEEAVALMPLPDAILAAFRQTAHLGSCGPDLRRYSCAVCVEDAQQLANEMHRHCDQVAASAASSSSSSSSPLLANGSATNALNSAAPARQPLPEAGDDDSAAARVVATAAAASAPLDVLRCRVSAHLVEADLGLPCFQGGAPGDRGPGVADQQACRLMRTYAESLPLTSGGDQHEKGPADDLVPLAMAAVMAGLSQDGSAGAGTRRLLQVLLAVGAAILHRPSSAALHLSGCAAASLLLAPGRATIHYQGLEVKHIQHETLGRHMHMPICLAACGVPGGRLAAVAEPLLALHCDHLRDAGDTLVMAYRRGTYSKVLEFVDFKERLEASHSRATARVEVQIQRCRGAAAHGAQELLAVASAACDSLAIQSPSCLDASLLQPGRLTFNEDWTTRPCWLPPSSAPPGLALVDWWDAADGTAVHGYGRCWWSRANATAWPLPQEAAQVRKGLAAALRRRALLPQLLAACLRLRRPPQAAEAAAAKAALLANPEQQPSAAQLVAELAESLRTNAGGGGGGGENSCRNGKAYGRQQQQQQPLARACELLTLAVMRGGADVQQAAAAAAGSSGGGADSDGSARSDIDRAAASLSDVAAVVREHCDRLASGLSPSSSSDASGGNGGGGPMAAIAGLLAPQHLACCTTLATEDAAWLCCLLQCWAAALKQGQEQGEGPGQAGGPGKRKGRSKAGTAETAPAMLPRQLAGPARELRDALSCGLGRVHDALAAEAERPLRECVDAALKEAQKGGPSAAKLGCALWQYEPRFNARQLVEAVVAGQRQVAAAVAREVRERMLAASKLVL